MKRSYAYSLCFLTFFLWGSNYVVSKFAFGYFSPLTLLFIRNLIAIVPMYIAAHKKGFKKVQKQHIKYFLICGIVGYSFSSSMVLTSTNMMSSTIASLINSANPIFIMFFAAISLKERLTVNKVVGLACALFGVIAVLGFDQGNVSLGGVLLSVCGVVTWALGSVTIRKISQFYSSEQVTLYCFIISLPVCLTMALLADGLSIEAVAPKAVIALIYIGVFTTGLTNLLWNKCLSVMDASTCSMFYPFQPVFSALLGILILGEPITSNIIIGGVLIFAGVIIGLGTQKH